MSVEMMSIAWKTQTSCHTEKLVLLALADNANDEGGYCWPCISTLAIKCGLSGRAVRKYIRELEQKKPEPWLVTVKKPGHSSDYFLKLPTPERGSALPRNAIPAPPERRSALPRNVVPATPERGSAITIIEPSKETKKKSAPLPPPIPEELNTPSFVTAWEEWRQHRIEIKHPLTPLSITKQFKKLTEWGEVRAIAAIDHSIGKGWRDCFEPKEEPPTYNANGRPTNRPLSIMDKKSIIAAKEIQAKELKDRFCSEVSTGDMWSDKTKRKEWFDLRNQIRDLNNQIARSA